MDSRVASTGGASCAARLRRLDETAEILVFDRGPYVAFANCGLPYFVGDVIADERKLLVASPEYNTMITPLLKNAIDWCSLADDNPFAGKVAAVISASPGAFGGIRSQANFNLRYEHLRLDL